MLTHGGTNTFKLERGAVILGRHDHDVDQSLQEQQVVLPDGLARSPTPIEYFIMVRARSSNT